MTSQTGVRRILDRAADRALDLRLLDHPSPPVVDLQRRVTFALLTIGLAGWATGRALWPGTDRRPPR